MGSGVTRQVYWSGSVDESAGRVGCGRELNTMVYPLRRAVEQFGGGNPRKKRRDVGGAHGSYRRNGAGQRPSEDIAGPGVYKPKARLQNALVIFSIQALLAQSTSWDPLELVGPGFESRLAEDRERPLSPPTRHRAAQPREMYILSG